MERVIHVLEVLSIILKLSEPQAMIRLTQVNKYIRTAIRNHPEIWSQTLEQKRYKNVYEVVLYLKEIKTNEYAEHYPIYTLTDLQPTKYEKIKNIISTILNANFQRDVAYSKNRGSLRRLKGPCTVDFLRPIKDETWAWEINGRYNYASHPYHNSSESDYESFFF